MYEKLEECPVCSFTSHENYLICDDHSVSHESFALVRCPKCHLIYTNPRPSQENIHTYYASDDYISHTSKATNLVNQAYKLARYFTMRWKHGIITKLHPTPGTLLDFGTGTGDFLRHMKQRKWQTAGIEPNPIASKRATSHGLEIFPQLSKENKKPYDIITAWHVLEHVHDLKETLRQLRKRLNPHGYLIIALPNHLSYDAQTYQSHWAGYDVPRHLYHFSPNALPGLLSQVKLRLRNTIPMPLDAYYVSILSAKYKSSSRPILEGIRTGYRSNQHASRNDKQYSSLIYVISQ